MRYRRALFPGASYFFTVVTAKRRPVFTAPETIELLRQAMRKVRRMRPFIIDAVVVLPDHLHCIWTLPPDDADYSTRWRLIKTWFSKRYAHKESRLRLPIWQNRYWDHLIRDERDWRRHMDYIHYNPVKHGYVQSVSEWPYSSFAYCVRKGWYEADWGKNVDGTVLAMECE